MTLAQIIDEFARKYADEYSDPRTAWGRCDAASYNFIAFAKQHGYEGELKTYTFYASTEEHKIFAGENNSDQVNPDPATYKVFDAAGYVLRNDCDVQMCTWHCVIDAGHILIDFTARQYRTHYAYPHIIAVEEKAFAAKAGASW